MERLQDIFNFFCLDYVLHFYHPLFVTKNNMEETKNAMKDTAAMYVFAEQ